MQLAKSVCFFAAVTEQRYAYTTSVVPTFSRRTHHEQDGTRQPLPVPPSLSVAKNEVLRITASASPNHTSPVTVPHHAHEQPTSHTRAHGAHNTINTNHICRSESHHLLPPPPPDGHARRYFSRLYTVPLTLAAAQLYSPRPTQSIQDKRPANKIHHIIHSAPFHLPSSQVSNSDKNLNPSLHTLQFVSYFCIQASMQPTCEVYCLRRWQSVGSLTRPARGKGVSPSTHLDPSPHGTSHDPCFPCSS